MNPRACRLSVLLLLLLVFAVACSSDRTDTGEPTANKGVIDLTGWNFQRDGTIKLDGEWKFYWNQLLPADKSIINDAHTTAEYMSVPGVWNNRPEELPKLPMYGFATYRLRVRLADINKPLALKIPHMSSAYDMFLNGKKISSNGKIGKRPDQSQSEFKPLIFDFTPEKPEFELVVHVSNFEYYKGGIWRSIILGGESDIREKNLRKMAYQLLYFGSIMIIALYNIGMFLFRRQEKAPLYFGLFCFLISIRIIVTDEIYITYVIHDLPWHLLVRCQILTFYLAPPVFIVYLHSLYPKEFIRTAYQIIVAFGLLFSAMVIVTPVTFFTSTLIIYQAFLIFCLFYVLFILIWAARRKREGAYLFIAGYIVTFAAIVNDILFVHFVVNTGFFVQAGFFVFILLQVILLISRSSNAFSRVESLGEQLVEFNINLENKVQQRTNELAVTLDAVESTSKKIMSSIEYAKRIQDSLLPIASEVREFLPNSFFIWRPRDIVGGDIHMVKKLAGKYIIAVMDCTGHGVPGAFMTMIASSGMNRIVVDDGCLDPAEILNRLNFIIKTSLQQEKDQALSDDGLDASICVIDPERQTLTFAGARLPLLIIENQMANLIRGDRQSIGYKKSVLSFQFTNHKIRFNHTTCFYLFTDGIIDQLGGDKQYSFGKRRFKNLILEVQNKSFDEQEQAIVNAFKSYKGDHETQDDITVIGFRINKPTP